MLSLISADKGRQYYPVMNTPVSSSVTVLADPPFSAKLQEDIVEGDPDSILRDEIRVFHGLSVSGDVTGKYVYAGYGRKADFDLLQDKGQSGVSRARFLAAISIDPELLCRNRLLRNDCDRQVRRSFPWSQDQG